MIQGLTFVIYGTPRTKKNHGRRIKRGNRKFDIPSKAYEDWTLIARKSLPLIRQQIDDAGVVLPIAADVNCAAVFYRDADAGDAVGYYQGLADWLENVGILVNDVQIRTWDRSELRKDATLPRIEITLDQLGPREQTPRVARKRATKGAKRG